MYLMQQRSCLSNKESESELALLARYEEFVIVDSSSTVQQSDRTGHRQQKNNIQIGNVQNGANAIYNTDNYV